jgi:hypothetical protein
LEVLNPSSVPETEPEKYQLYLKTDTGKIQVYFASGEQISNELDPSFP